ncbi:MAG: transglutaminase-like domain-containing protein [Verrucomicrobiales bacterium]
MKRSFRRSFGLVCLAAYCGLVAAAAGAPAESPPDPPPPKPPQLELPIPDSVLTATDRRWMSVYFHGFKAGWAVHSLGPAVVDGRACVCSNFEMTTEFKALSRVNKRFTSVRKCYSKEPPYRAFLIEQTDKMGDQSRRAVIRNDDSGTRYSVDITEGGEAKSRQFLHLDIRLSQETSPRVWAADPGRRPGDAITSAKLYPTGTLKINEQTATILRKASWSGPSGTIPVWEIDTCDYGTQNRSLMRVSRRDGKPVSLFINANMELKSDTEKAAKQMPELAPDVYVLMSISASRRLGKPSALSEVVMELTAPKGKQVPELPETANQTVERKPNGSVIVTITRNAGRPQPASAEDRAGALKSTPRYPLDNETVRNLAASAVKGASDDRSTVQKLLDFTRSYVQEAPNVKSLTVMDIIQSKKGDCTAHSLLFTTLARAAGVPAREVGGWMYSGDRNQAFGGHAWSEVILDGQWVPVDSVWTEMQISPGHIQGYSWNANDSKPPELVTGMKARIISFKSIP